MLLLLFFLNRYGDDLLVTVDIRASVDRLANDVDVVVR